MAANLAERETRFVTTMAATCAVDLRWSAEASAKKYKVCLVDKADKWYFEVKAISYAQDNHQRHQVTVTRHTTCQVELEWLTEPSVNAYRVRLAKVSPNANGNWIEDTALLAFCGLQPGDFYQVEVFGPECLLDTVKFRAELTGGELKDLYGRAVMASQTVNAQSATKKAKVRATAKTAKAQPAAKTANARSAAKMAKDLIDQNVSKVTEDFRGIGLAEPLQDRPVGEPAETLQDRPVGEPAERLQDRPVGEPALDNMMKLTWFYRVRDPGYFDEIKNMCDNVIKVQGNTKDNNGDPASPINGALEGVFFSVNVDSGTGQLPRNSSFGTMRLKIPVEAMFEKMPNLYFTDFYCNSKAKNHYITLVATKEGGEADKFCRKKELVPLGIESNPFVQRDPRLGWRVTTASWVEIFCTEDIDIDKMKGKFQDMNPVHKGRAKYNCEICNLRYQEALPKITPKKKLLNKK